MITILIAMYNEERFIISCLESIYRAGNKGVEVVVVDDFSNDNSFFKVDEFISQHKDYNIKLIRNTNKGKVFAFNAAYEESSGDFICFLGADDLIVSEHLIPRAACLSEYNIPAISLCKIKTFSDDKRLDGLVFPRARLKGACSGGAMLFNKKFGSLIFPIPTTLPNEDSWIKLHLKYSRPSIVHYPVVSYMYRQHANNSVKLKSGFSEFNEVLSERNESYKLFLDVYGSKMKDADKEKLSSYVDMESYRSEGSFFKIMCLSKVSLRDRISFVFTSNSFFYNIRVSLYKFLSGR